VLLVLLVPVPLNALDQETQTWTTAQVLLPLGETLDAGLRYRTRFSGVFDNRRLYQFQFTLGRTLGDGRRIRLGYEQFRTPIDLSENRFFPELQLRTRFAELPLRHRLRVEVRDINRLPDPIYRLRYKLAYRRPLTSAGAYLELRNEIFVSLSEEDPGIERGPAQNRVGFTLGQAAGKRSRVEFRYQWGYIDNALIERGEHLIQLHWTWDGR